jgi:uncharacterized protein (TIGR00661 family)
LNTKKNILICPLEWGLGHAARMVPIARRLRELNQNVIFGSGEEHLAFFRKEVPGATYINFPGFKMKYSRYLPQYLMILLNLPRFIYHSISEHYRLKSIIRDNSVNIVISDNRPGLWNRSVRCIYVTHQLRIRFPSPFRFLEFTGIAITGWLISRYTLCFIPDLDGDLNISGDLSHGLKLPENARYTGILSRFGKPDKSVIGHSGKYLVILSGPEPQRSLLKKRILGLNRKDELQIIFFEGNPTGYNKSVEGSNEFIDHPDEDMAIEYICSSTKIICRSGYTTIMELVSLGRSALLIPTYGQTEQEYLARYLTEKGWFSTASMKELNESIITQSYEEEIPESFVVRSQELFYRAISEMLEDQDEKTNS